MTGMIGKIVGDYQITEQLGEGGMGVVFKGVHQALGQIVAIKMLHPRLTKAGTVKKRFLQEAKAMARLRHPNILALYNFKDTQEGCFIIMEYVEGVTFEDIIEQKNIIPPQEAVDMFIPTLQAMGYAHNLGIIHRDIKPSNLMKLHNGVVKVLDFGTAKILGGEALTQAGMTLGTIVYMSPEQLLGRDLTAGADIYSLGVTLYEMTTGRLPFFHENDMELMRMILKTDPTPPSQFYPPMPAELEQIILKAMAKKPEDRYQTDEQFLEALKTLGGNLGGSPASSGSQPVAQQPQQSPQAQQQQQPSAPQMTAPQAAPQQPSGPQMTMPQAAPQGTMPQMPQAQQQQPAPQPAAGAGSSMTPLRIAALVIMGLGVVAGAGMGGAGFLIPAAAAVGGCVLVGGILFAIGGPKTGAAGAGAGGNLGKRPCPQCGRILLPTMTTCPFCNPQAPKVGETTLTTDDVPMSGQEKVASGSNYEGPTKASSGMLKVVAGPSQGKDIELSQNGLTFGRAEDNDVVLNDLGVSSHHARIDWYNGAFFLSDLQSSNGTYLDNTRVDQTPLRHGNVIVMGRTQINVVLE